MVRAARTLAGVAFLSGCVGAPARAPSPHPPSPSPPPAPARALAVVETAKPVSEKWRDWPVATGTWSYRTVRGGTAAAFGTPGEAAALSFRCETASRRIFVARATTLTPDRIGGQMTVHTSFGELPWPVTASTEAGVPGAYAVAIRAANDSGFDRIAFSRGRFAIEAPGAAPIAVPGWAEVSRVIEDCRG